MGKLKRWSALLLLSMLAACAPQTTPPEASLPTLLVLPSATPEQTAPPPAETPLTPVAQAPDLPTATPPAPATASPSPTATPAQSATATVTASLTITDTPTRTPTATPLPTEIDGPLLALARLALEATVVTPDFRLLTVTPTGFAPPATLCLPPADGFGVAMSQNPNIATLVGCPIGASLSYGAAVQRFERGLMIYVASLPPTIYVVDTGSGRWAQYADTFTEGIDPQSGNETPPAGLFEPIRGFGKVWRTTPTVRAGLGWATSTETGTTVAALGFERGQVIAIPLFGQMVVLASSGSAQVVSGTP
ncbi:MAG: hypothetical protein MUC99_01605 [Anaerolineae bacterium]|jgi:hypothetical protein|nr:hypothetical protein [Anaerolineae bacterium]